MKKSKTPTRPRDLGMKSSSQKKRSQKDKSQKESRSTHGKSKDDFAAKVRKLDKLLQGPSFPSLEQLRDLAMKTLLEKLQELADKIAAEKGFPRVKVFGGIPELFEGHRQIFPLIEKLTEHALLGEQTSIELLVEVGTAVATALTRAEELHQEQVKAVAETKIAWPSNYSVSPYLNRLEAERIKNLSLGTKAAVPYDLAKVFRSDTQTKVIAFCLQELIHSFRSHGKFELAAKQIGGVTPLVPALQYATKAHDEAGPLKVQIPLILGWAQSVGMKGVIDDSTLESRSRATSRRPIHQRSQNFCASPALAHATQFSGSPVAVGTPSFCLVHPMDFGRR